MNKSIFINLALAAGLSAGLGVALAAPALGQSQAQAAAPDTNRVVVPLSHPSQPATLKVSTLNGSLTVRAYSGKSVVITTSGNSDHRDRRDREDIPAEAQGMHRLSTNAGLTAEEDNNVVTVHTSVLGGGGGNLVIEVPTDTSVSLHTVSGGTITVQGVHGDISVENTNGNIKLDNVAGSIVASALNGRITAVVDQLDAHKPSSFSSMNGTIDLTLPANVAADLKLRTARGDIYMDNGFQFQQSQSPVTSGGQRDAGGMYKIRLDRSISGTLNGGGPEIQVRNFNGNIYIHKGK